MKEGKCPTKMLSGFLSDSLFAAENESIERHLESCSQCRATLEIESGGTAFWSSVSDMSDDQWDRDWQEFSGSSSLDGTEASESFDHAEEIDPVQQHETRLRAIFETIKPLLSPSDDPQSAGKIGGYEVLGLIGSGGMGVVLKARDVSLDRVVAIKLLAPHLSAFESSRKRFRREAKAAAAVKHDGIISIHGVDSHCGVPYFVMPYEAGPSLQLRIRKEGKLTIEESLRVAVQIASALRAAHQTGLVHRDIKPSNILLAPGTERALLMDFGLAQVCDQQNITQTGMVSGTPIFMSPEQARGENVDSRSDLFSLGSLIFMMLTGHPPISGDSTYAIVRQIGGQKMPRLQIFDPSIPIWIDELVARLHAIEPKNRVQSSQELEELLVQCLAHVQNPSENRLPGTLQSKANRSISRWTTKLAIAAGCAFMGLVGLFSYQWFVPASRASNPAKQSTVQSRDKTTEPVNDKLAASPYVAPVDDWDDQLDPVIENIRRRIRAIESEINGQIE